MVGGAAPEPLSTGGEKLNVVGDDVYTNNPYQLPFDFTFFGSGGRGVFVSSNGALYFYDPPRLHVNGVPVLDDAVSSVPRLGGYRMIAALWDDLRTDLRTGGDVFVVNKADRDGADDTVRELRHMIQLGNRERSVEWRTPVVRTVASRGDGIPELVESLAAHRRWLEESGTLDTRRSRRARSEIEAIVLAELRRRLGGEGGLVPDELASAVASGETDVYAAAERVVGRVTGEPSRQ